MGGVSEAGAQEASCRSCRRSELATGNRDLGTLQDLAEAGAGSWAGARGILGERGVLGKEGAAGTGSWESARGPKEGTA